MPVSALSVAMRAVVSVGGVFVGKGRWTGII